MSYDKQAKAQRRYDDYVIIQRQLFICWFHRADVTTPVHYFRKNHALNCGRSKCFLCSNPRRRSKRLTIPEIAANEAFKYELSQL